MNLLALSKLRAPSSFITKRWERETNENLGSEIDTIDVMDDDQLFTGDTTASFHYVVGRVGEPVTGRNHSGDWK